MKQIKLMGKKKKRRIIIKYLKKIIIISEEEFPKLKSNHKILAEKVMTFNGVKIEDKENENELDRRSQFNGF